MRLPQIRMEQRFIQLGLEIEKPVQEIQQPKAELNMRQEPAILEIHSPRGELTIDTSEAQANLDLRSPRRRIQDNAEYGYQKWLEAIAQISMEGDRLAAIENKGNPIADLAFEDSGIYQGKEIIAAGSLIGDGVEIRYEAKKPEINVIVRGVRMDPEIKKPILNYTPGKVRGKIEVWNSLTIDFVGLYVDKKR
ncbi:DUF6470 family protein [Brevibacillus sp. GCM10020057]|uniref:DUF6470 family protein n=1 Tax=Brevibacillus sp. GCM10020057 TaxID=3317327 RepID=UPI003638620D